MEQHQRLRPWQRGSLQDSVRPARIHSHVASLIFETHSLRQVSRQARRSVQLVPARIRSLWSNLDRTAYRVRSPALLPCDAWADRHDRICQDIFLRLKDNGFLVENSMEQYYCEKDKKCAICCCSSSASASNYSAQVSRRPLCRGDVSKVRLRCASSSPADEQASA